ncbi:membrane-bound transcription factor site-2 protease [Phtheirospermum japonicum]|uniref:Endopeptidase S2P n=1 Tax=Phtheirospermum japonicum TaxID=374723 RepID=A0A830C702_9LAMI|nr:membrane-bound transcription factor site-2 protease [Phtheirospermum japonicum]
MDGRRTGRRWSNQTLLPLRPTRQLVNTVSCCYCDFKFQAFNEPLFQLGRKHSKFLRIWFSMGIGFSLAALFGVTLIILREFVRLYTGNDPISYFIPGSSVSFPNMGHLCLSTVISVAVHEFGHALAAAGEGVPTEYVAVFWAGLFPGALVAFDRASLNSLPGPASLRIYCAGVWHNAALCAACNLGLLLLPFALSLFYLRGEGPMVLDVPPVSPLSGYLSPRDVILSLNGVRVRDVEEWRQTIGSLTERNVGKGYCVPRSLSARFQFEGNRTVCPDELIAFGSATCDENNYIHCLDAKDVVKLQKCGSPINNNNKSDCFCSEVDESCLTPIQMPGLGWVEITYSSLQCRNSSGCVQTFVFIGDLVDMARSVRLTSYQPRWSVYFGAYFPNVLEKLLTCCFHVSLVLALLNSLPVYYLDGESILEGGLNHLGYLSSRMKRLILRCCLVVGTFISACFIVQTVFVAVT